MHKLQQFVYDPHYIRQVTQDAIRNKTSECKINFMTDVDLRQITEEYFYATIHMHFYGRFNE